MPKSKYGKLSMNNVPLYRHENQTILYLLSQGYDIQIIPKSNQPGIKTADIIMCSMEWEMKSPQGQGKWLIKNTLQEASHQSTNVILDLRRIKLDHNRCMREIEQRFKSIKRLRNLKIITKSGKSIDMKK